MLKIDDDDNRADLFDDYPEEVLESEWNPVVAQIQLLKRHRQEVQQAALAPLWLPPPEIN